MTPHKHADAIKAWADGALIEWRDPSKTSVWKLVHENKPHWDSNVEYRPVRCAPKWLHLLMAQDAGKACQMRDSDGEWKNGIWAFDSEDREYRLKPEPIKFRLFLWECPTSIPTKRFVVAVVNEKEQQAQPRETWKGFVHWIDDWQTVEQP